MPMSENRKIKEFDLMYSQLYDLSKALPEFQFKTVTALLVIIGWLVTSVSAQGFIKLNSSVTLPATIFVFGLLVVFKSIWIFGHYHRIRGLHKKIENLAIETGLTVDSVSALKLSIVLPATYFVINVLLSAAVVVTVWLICNPLAN